MKEILNSRLEESYATWANFHLQDTFRDYSVNTLTGNLSLKYPVIPVESASIQQQVGQGDWPIMSMWLGQPVKQIVI